MSTERKAEQALSLHQIRNAVFINVLSAVITSIVIAAGAILWRDTQSTKERLGFLVAELHRKEEALRNAEKRSQQQIDILTRHIIELEEFVVNDGYNPPNDLLDRSVRR